MDLGLEDILDNPITHNCGVVCAIKKENISKGELLNYVQNGLLTLQSRGYKASGISSLSENRIRRNLKLGTVPVLFGNYDDLQRRLIFENHSLAEIILAHVRYTTSGKRNRSELDILEECQPWYRAHGRGIKEFSFAYNGNLTNYNQLKKILINAGYNLKTSVDTELIEHFISKGIQNALVENNNQNNIDFGRVINFLYENLDGAYSTVYFNAKGDVYAFKDPHSIRPLCYGENDKIIAIASESSALEKMGIKRSDILELNSGKYLHINQKGKNKIFEEKEIPLTDKILKLHDNLSPKHCFFEWNYFAKSTSIIQGIDVNTIRREIGKILGNDQRLVNMVIANPSDYVVLPVPDTSIPYAHSLAKTLEINLGIKNLYHHSIIKYANAGRTFISEGDIMKKIIEKYSFIRDEIFGKKTILVDDSIVRNNTLKIVAKYLTTELGAKEVHIVSGTPPIKYPCFYGISFATIIELVAGGLNNIVDIEKKIISSTGVKSVTYPSIEGMKSVYKNEKVNLCNSLCTACLDGNYPTVGGQKCYEKELKSYNKIIKL